MPLLQGADLTPLSNHRSRHRAPLRLLLRDVLPHAGEPSTGPVCAADRAGRRRRARARFAADIAGNWPIFFLYLYLLAALLAASVIDAEQFIIPTSIIWSWMGGIVVVGLLVHTLADRPNLPGALGAGPLGGAVAAGGALGLLASILLLRLGKLPLSFADGGPLLEVEKAAHERAARPPGRPALPSPPHSRSTPRCRCGRKCVKRCSF